MERVIFFFAMCVNPREVWANFVRLVTCTHPLNILAGVRRADRFDTQNLSSLDKLPLEILENIILYLSYQEISNLRSVNRRLNRICSTYLNRAFFNIKNDIKSYIFLSYKNVHVEGKFISECIRDYNQHHTYFDCIPFRPVMLNLLFANKLYVILFILRGGIYRYLFYRKKWRKSSGDDFVFIYGNVIDWAIQQLNYVKKNQVALLAFMDLKPPADVSQHLGQLVAFYKAKMRSSSSTTKLEKYLDVHFGPTEKNYETDIRPIVSQVELAYIYVYNSKIVPRMLNKAVLSFEKYGMKAMFEYREELFREAILFTSREDLKNYYNYIYSRDI